MLESRPSCPSFTARHLRHPQKTHVPTVYPIINYVYVYIYIYIYCIGRYSICVSQLTCDIPIPSPDFVLPTLYCTYLLYTSQSMVWSPRPRAGRAGKEVTVSPSPSLFHIYIQNTRCYLHQPGSWAAIERARRDQLVKMTSSVNKV